MKKKLGNSFELIIIPNNCSDRTFEIVKNFSIRKKNIFVKNISQYVGKGGAVIRGFELAKGEFIGFSDADGSTSPEEFYKLYKTINNFHGIIGSRRIAGSKIIPKRSISKALSSWLFNLVVKILFGFNYKDTQCGAKIFKKDVAKYFVLNHKEDGWAFDVDLLYLCKKKDYKIKEFPIVWEDNPTSHLTTLDGIKSVFELIKYRVIS